MWWKKNKWKVIVPLAIVVILAAAFLFGGDAPGSGSMDFPDETPSGTETTQGPAAGSSASEDREGLADSEAAPAEQPAPEEQPGDAPATEPAEDSPAPAPKPGASQNEEKDEYLTDPVPADKPAPVEPQDSTISQDSYTCTISISCATVLDNMEDCDPTKQDLIPEDGWILLPVEATFYEGESVFHVLQRVCKQNQIHMEFTDTPLYNSAYIEGIGNLYEFDVGELSGWAYKVNGWFPNYGCSRYMLKDGDEICWLYTCNLGADVGGYNVLDGGE